MKRFFSILIIITTMLSLSGCRKAMTEQHFFAMDTVMTLQLDTADPALFTLCQEEIERLEGLFSTTKAESEVARLNRGEQPALSEDTQSVLKDGLSLSAKTDQAFCLSLYPASKLWDFGGEPKVPSQLELDAVRPLIDDTALTLNGETLSLPQDAGIDLGGIAKGYAADRLASLLDRQGVSHYFLSLGGNVQVGGGNPNGSPWRIGIADPEGGEYVGLIELADGAVVTSGGYQRNFTEGGRVYHHILDRTTLRPAESGLLSATAITQSGTTADALSTAFFVMGEEKALAYCADHAGIDCILITSDHRVVTSDGISFTLNHTEYTYE